MEKAIGLICEYNPLHAGHAWQLDLLRARFPGKAIVLVMSGNFVQRAEAAVCDHYARARAALECGADLVLLLPFPYSTFGAQGYAASALSVLGRLGVVDQLAFGAEAGDSALLKKIAKVLCSADFEESLSHRLRADTQAAYAHLRSEVLEEFCPGAGELLKRPNNILAVEYLAEIERRGYDMSPVILPREPEPSASALRKKLSAGEEPGVSEVPSASLRKELKSGEVPQDKLGALLLSALRAGMECPELALLGARLSRSARTARDFDDFLLRAKTRKVTVARLRRGVLHAYFEVEEPDTPEVPYSILLGANATGRKILSFIYKEGKLPVYTKPSAPLKASAEIARMAELHARADSVYAGLLNRGGDWFLKQNPKIVNKL